MKMINRSLLAVAAALALAGTAQAADIVGAASPATDAQLYVKVGASEVNGGPHSAGKAGIGVGTVSNAKPVDFRAWRPTRPRPPSMVSPYARWPCRSPVPLAAIPAWATSTS